MAPSCTGDYWTRRDPDKIGIAYWCGLYQTNAVVGDPYYEDRFMSRTFGQISRMRGVYWIGFDATNELYLYGGEWYANSGDSIYRFSDGVSNIPLSIQEVDVELADGTGYVKMRVLGEIYTPGP